MSSTVTIEEAQANLADLIARLGPGDEVVITQNAKPVAKIVAQPRGTRQARSQGARRANWSSTRKTTGDCRTLGNTCNEVSTRCARVPMVPAQ